MKKIIYYPLLTTNMRKVTNGKCKGTLAERYTRRDEMWMKWWWIDPYTLQCSIDDDNNDDSDDDDGDDDDDDECGAWWWWWENAYNLLLWLLQQQG